MVTEVSVARDLLGAALCRQNLIRFLTRAIRIESDNPEHAGPVKWQPWPALVARAEAWEAGTSEVVLKARQLGFSWLGAAYDLWRAMYHGWAVGSFSVGQREARKQLWRSEYIYQHLDPMYRVKATWRADDAEFDSGGSILALPSTEQAGISYTFRLVRMDEAAFHPYGAADYAAVRPTLSAGGQFLALSTADPTLGSAGFFHDLYFAAKRGETPYRAVFVPWDARPGRDTAWLARERSAYAGFPEEFDAYHPATDAEAFVGRSGLVYPMFQEAIHVQVAPCPWEACKVRIAGVDWGGGDPTAVVLLGRTASGRIHQYGEFYQRGPVSVTDIAEFLIEWDQRGRLSAVECDPSQETSIATLNLNALRGRVYAADNAREGIGLTAMLLEQKRLTIDPLCKSSIAEFPGYRWANRTDPNNKTRYATSTTVDHHADAMDARRYALKKMLRFETVALTRAAVWRGGKKPVRGYV